jgi:predicted ATPase
LQGQITGDLPIQSSPIVGRRSELETIQALISKRRLVTLVGSGGCGKTRLALEVLSAQRDHYPEGVRFVDLSPLTAGEQVLSALASALSVKEEADKSLLESVLSALGDGKRLLLLDNCEHLLDACAELASSILTSCPDAHLLATSREILSVRGETMFRVPSLSVPNIERPNPDDVTRTDAGRLFLDRARDQQLDFEIDEENAEAVARICSRLDGIPLAIELAAAQVRSLSVEEILEGLNDCFRVLTSGERSALPRQRTIRATIEWSTNLLEPDQRLLLARLSVFMGGFTLEAVDAICGDGDSQLPGLLALADKNLIVAKESGQGDRRRLLETVRQFATKHLSDQGECEMTLTRHRDYFQALASDARPEKHQDTAGWLKRLSVERNNLRAAILWSLSQQDGLEAALRISADLGWYWYQQGQIAEGCKLLAEGLSRSLEGITLNTRLDALCTYAWLLNSSGNSQEAAYRFKEMAALAMETEDRLREAEALNGLGLVAYHRSYDQARSYFEEALELNLTLSGGGNSLANLNNLCLLSLSAGEYEAAIRYGEQTVKIARQKGRLEVEGVALFLLAVNADAMDDYAKAGEIYREAEKLQRKHGFRQRLLHTLLIQADHFMDGEDAMSAQHLYREAADVCQELQATTIEHQVFCGYGACLALRERKAESRRLLLKGLERCKTVDDKSHLARAIEDASIFLVLNSELETAARLLGAAWQLREDHPGRIHPNIHRRLHRLSQPIRDVIGNMAFDRQFELGSRDSSTQAIGFALEFLLDENAVV